VGLVTLGPCTVVQRGLCEKGKACRGRRSPEGGAGTQKTGSWWTRKKTGLKRGTQLILDLKKPGLEGTARQTEGNGRMVKAD